MGPVEELVTEHAQIKLLLRVLEKMCERIDEEESTEVEHIGKALDFIKMFADRCHHGKEEVVLFPVMKALGIEEADDLITVLLTEHEIGRSYVRAASEGFEEYKKGASGGRKITDNLLKYVKLLDPHINKENSILFPMVDKNLSEKEQDIVKEDFERIEKERVGGRHEQLLRDLYDLRDRYLR